jgi:hypothetical protein
MFIPDPDFYPFRIPDPKTTIKERVKKLVVKPFFVAKLFNFLNAEEKNLGQFSKKYGTFYPKNCHQALKIWGWDPGSGKKTIPDPGSGSRGQKGTVSRIRNTGKYRNFPESLLKLSCNYLPSHLPGVHFAEDAPRSPPPPSR